MKKIRLLMAAGIMALAISGCSLFGGMNPDEIAPNVTTTSVFVTKDGAVKQVIVDVLDKEYYNAGELQQVIQSEIASYNAKNPDGVTLSNYDVPSEEHAANIYVTLDYKSVADYSSFNDCVLFQGTVAEAIAAGYEIPSVKDSAGNVIGSVGNADTSTSNIVISEEAVDMYVSGKIAYVSNNVSSFSDYEATLPGGELAFVIYK